MRQRTAAAGRSMTDILTAEDLEGTEGDDYLISIEEESGPEETVRMRLVTLERRAPQPFPGRQRDPFSLFFAGPMEPFVHQGTFYFRHAESGRKMGTLFIVPMGPKGGEMTYQVIFN